MTWTADPDCELCQGSGVDPRYPGDDYGLGYGIDPGSLTPCECIMIQWSTQEGGEDGQDSAG